MNVPFYLLVKFVSWLILRLAFSLEVRGQVHVPRSGAFIVASNHVSYLDPLVVGVACPRRLVFMARQTLARHPLMRWWLRQMGVILLQRDAGDLRALRTAAHCLRDGHPVTLFPEGQRQRTGTLGEVKRGVGVLAMMADVPIVPILVHGTFEAFPWGSRTVRRTKIQVAFGPRITYTEGRFFTGRSVQAAGRIAHHEALAEAVAQGWRQLQDGFNRQVTTTTTHDDGH